MIVQSVCAFILRKMIDVSDPPTQGCNKSEINFAFCRQAKKEYQEDLRAAKDLKQPSGLFTYLTSPEGY